MKLAFIFGPFCLGGGANGLDFGRLFTSPRGLTGSELGFIRMAQELAGMGHELTLYTYPAKGTTLPEELSPGVKVRHYEERVKASHDGTEAVVSWNEAEPLLAIRNVRKIVSLQINTIVGSLEAVQGVDLWLSPSESHRRMILGDEQNPRTHYVSWQKGEPYVPNPVQWKVVPDGCDPEVYDQLWEMGVRKVPGRVIWTSSPDRGLHWLLSIWPRIRREVPHTELRIFYRLEPWLEHCFGVKLDRDEPGESIREQISRAHYIRESLERMGDSGISVYDSVSRRDIAREQAEAECFPYTCDTRPTWSEGFSCSLVENCAARSCPITCEIDAFGEIYGGSVPMTGLLNDRTILEFADLTVRALTDTQWREEVNARVRVLSERFTWKLAAESLLSKLSHT